MKFWSMPKGMEKVFLACFAVLVFGLIPLAGADPPGLKTVGGEPFQLDLRYATGNNFLKKNVYAEFGLDRCWVHPDLYSVLEKLALTLKEQNLKLVFWDCFRPLPVQEAMWKLVPDARYVANPKTGSNHNRGVAVDVTLADAGGKELPMPTGFDDFTAKAAPAYRCGKEETDKCRNRDRLIQLMKSAGLKPLTSEWWHFQLPAAGKYPVLEGVNAKVD